jgi:hypothetical protein
VQSWQQIPALRGGAFCAITLAGMTGGLSWSGLSIQIFADEPNGLRPLSDLRRWT